MREDSLHWNLELDELDNIKEISSRDIAIIGIDVKFPKADNVQQYWSNLVKAKDCIGNLSKKRMDDIIAYLKLKGEYDEYVGFAKGGYLEEIDKFDYEFFKITKREAQLMDPNQLIFLETVWKAIEDAGYGGSQLVGSNTGVYVGFTPRNEYYQYIKDVSPDLLRYADVGNLSSIIASRISYILDLKGPSMIINTECSSSLVALNLACKSLREAEIDTAIVGGIRLAFCPSYTENTLGVESTKEMVHAFDDEADGSVFGEGSVAIVLKNLNRAIEDRDHIWAVIKGSCINQDGATVGITAPNVASQEEVIVGAWNDAEIEPETISYIETHGTGTILGDPIEISGISHAFQRYTKKKMFCGVGSVKTNIGHLDNVSGLASLVKMVMALQKKQIPASRNFKVPNRKVNWEISAVYVNDRLRDWEAGDKPRRCGISSFGLSGTNCHVILEEAPESNQFIRESKGQHIFTLSSNCKEGLRALVKEYLRYLEENTEIRIGDLCYTANTGRGHYSFRLAVIVKDISQLKKALNEFDQNLDQFCSCNNQFYHKHHIAADEKEELEESDIYNHQRKQLDSEAKVLIDQIAKNTQATVEQLENLCDLYVRGANPNWNQYYSNDMYYKVSLPTYVFQKQRCWLEIEEKDIESQVKGSPDGKKISSLLDYRIAESLEQDIYVTHFCVDKYWVLKEHRIYGNYLAPGTMYLEMVKQCLRIFYDWEKVRFHDVVFVNSLVVKEEKEVQTIIEKREPGYNFKIVERQTNAEELPTWIVLCEGKVSRYVNEDESQDSLDVLKDRFSHEVYMKGDKTDSKKRVNLELGPRWTQLLQNVYRNENEILAKFRIPDEFIQDINEYDIHPSLLDMAVNMISQNLAEEIYLPFSYGDFQIYEKTSQILYSHITLKERKRNTETITCDVELFQGDGKCIGTVKNVVCKRVNKVRAAGTDEFYRLHYKKVDFSVERRYQNDAILIFENETKLVQDIVQSIEQSGRTVVHVKQGKLFEKESPDCYYVGNDSEHYRNIFKELQGRRISQILHLMSINESQCEVAYDQLDDCLNHGVYSLFLIAKTLLHMGQTSVKELTVLTDYAKMIEEGQKKVKPHNNALLALVNVIQNEFNGIKCYMLDFDESISKNEFVSFVNGKVPYTYVAYRNSQTWIEELDCIQLQRNYSISEKLKEDGIYIITGGMGGLGNLLTSFLVLQKKVNIALLGRKDLYDYEEKLEEIQNRFKDTGCSVVYYRTDISDKNQAVSTLNQLRKEYGTINGVFHLAGIVGNGFIKNKTLEDFQNVIRSKVYGTCILYELTQMDDLDFFVNYSSVSAIYGYPGQSDYSAANAYMDSFAAYSKLKNRNMLTINWAPWKEVGMAYAGELSDTGVFKLIDSKSAFSKLATIMDSTMNHVVIADLNYDVLANYSNQNQVYLSNTIIRRMEQQNRANERRLDKKRTTGSLSIKGRANGEYSKIERAVAKIWAEVLNMDTVDIYQEFFEIGGDSIQAVALFKKIDERFHGLVTIADVFTYASVNKMSQYIQDRVGDYREEDDIDYGKAVENNDNARSRYIMDVLTQLRNGTISIEEASITLKR